MRKWRTRDEHRQVLYPHEGGIFRSGTDELNQSGAHGGRGVYDSHDGRLSERTID